MPDLLAFLILTFASYRLTRLGGWDEFPLAVRVRDWVVGTSWIPVEPTDGVYGRDEFAQMLNARENTPSRPALAHLVGCAFCLGWWVSLTVYLAWWTAGAPGETSSAWFWRPVVPFAISGAVGLIAKNLDP